MIEKILGALLGLLVSWVINLITIAIVTFFMQFVGYPMIDFFVKGVWPILGMGLVYKSIKFILFAATVVSIINWLGMFVPSDTKTKKYWWNK